MDFVHYSFLYVNLKVGGEIMAKIDVLMATYNGSTYIEEQIESILKQTFKEFNLIIRDDQSTDNTVDIIRRYMLKDERITLYQNEVNLGYNENFMLLIEKSNAPFFAIADQDDKWHPTQLQDLYQAIKASNVDVVYGKSAYIDQHNKTIKHRDYIKEIQVFKTYELFEDNIVPGRNMLVNSRLKESLFPYPQLSRQFIYDWYISLKALENNGIYCLDKEINLYRIHTASVTNTDVYTPMHSKSIGQKVFYIENLRKKAIQSRLKRIEVFKSFLKNNDELKKYEVYINSLKTTKYINFNFIAFRKYMKIRTPYYKTIFLVVLHFPVIYRIFSLSLMKNLGELNEN